jgi:hypothetical protein
MKTAEWYSIQRRLREAERLLRKWPEPQTPMTVQIREGTASARLQEAGMLMAPDGSVSFTLKLPRIEPVDELEALPRSATT